MSGVDRFRIADGGGSGWPVVAVSSDCSGLDALWIDGVASLEFSSLETCERVGKIRDIPEIYGDSPIRDNW